MTFSRAQAIVNRISLDGFRYYLSSDWTVHVHMAIDPSKARHLDLDAMFGSLGPGDAIETSVRNQITVPPAITEDLLIRACLFIACQLAAHEIEEQFMVDGDYFIDPHKDGDVYVMSATFMSIRKT